METNLSEVVVYQSKLKQFGLAILSLLMLFSCFFLLIAGLVDGPFLLVIIALIGLIFFGYCTYYIFKQLFKGKKLVIVTPQGFYDYSSALATKKRLIPWEQVEKIQEQTMAGKSFVSVYLKAPDTVLSQLSAFQRKAIQANVNLGFGHINITLQSAKNWATSDLITQMTSYRSAAQKDK